MTRIGSGREEVEVGREAADRLYRWKWWGELSRGGEEDASQWVLLLFCGAARWIPPNIDVVTPSPLWPVLGSGVSISLYFFLAPILDLGLWY